ncbi:hypothetical protein FG386_002321 [Cryptosporidium ryanae]|uniref:uncharacterized protein n=1 Tax=Cryptosporidium ryanae TaxID=515981 RepID=UPI00351A6532|nr:hypothetical protein FG386_002321 [Cryptosporidium ryanae]
MNSGMGDVVREPVKGCQWLGNKRIHIRETRNYTTKPSKNVEFIRYEYNSTSGCELENYSRQIIGYGKWEILSVNRDENNYENYMVKMRINWKKAIVRTRSDKGFSFAQDKKDINWLYPSLDPVYYYDLNLINTCIKHATLASEYDTNEITTENIKLDGEEVLLSNEKFSIDYLPESKVEEALLRMVTGYSGNVISDMIKKDLDLKSKWENHFKNASYRVRKVCKWNDIKEFCLTPPSELVNNKNSCVLPSTEQIISPEKDTLKVSMYPFEFSRSDTDQIEFSKYNDC